MNGTTLIGTILAGLAIGNLFGAVYFFLFVGIILILVGIFGR